MARQVEHVDPTTHGTPDGDGIVRLLVEAGFFVHMWNPNDHSALIKFVNWATPTEAAAVVMNAGHHLMNIVVTLQGIVDSLEGAAGTVRLDFSNVTYSAD